MIEVSGLSKRFGSTVAVQDLSFRVEPGRVTGFLGPNGAGKSTTLRVLLGLVRPDAGTATVLGAPYRELEHPAGRVGAVLEASSFHPGRRGRDHLRIVARESRIPESRVDEVLATVELTEAAHRRVGGYSLGMKQRLALAGALLGDPQVVILDEPANGLDPRGMRWLRDLLRGLAEGGRAVLISSHVLAEVAQTADEVVIIDRGRFVAHSSVEEVVAGGSGGVRVRSPEAARLRELLSSSGVEAADARDGALLVRGVDAAFVGELAAQHGVVLHELVAESGTLEDVFLELTGGDAA